MLNANAKAFVPGGATTLTATAHSNVQELPLFRYSVTAPRFRVVDVDSVSQQLPTLPYLLSKRQLVPQVLGGSGFAATQQFVSEFFGSLTNSSLPTLPSGFLLSRELLSLSATETVHEANEREGFLLQLAEISSVSNADVSVAVSSLWESFFSQFGRDYRVTAFGYLQLQVGQRTDTDGEFHHFFFACTTPKKSQLVQLTASAFAPISKKTIEVNRIVPFALCVHQPIAIVVSLNCALENCSSVTVHWSESNQKTLQSLLEAEDLCHQQLTGKSSTAVINVQVSSMGSFSARIPFVDIVGMICNACHSFMGSVIGIVARTDDWKLNNFGLCDQWRFDPETPLADIVKRQEFVCPGSHLHSSFGRYPSGLFASRISARDYSTIIDDVTFGVTRVTQKEEVWLTRKRFTTIANDFAKETFKLRRQLIGVPVLLIVDSAGKLYCCDLSSSNTAVMTPSWSNPQLSVSSSLFVGTLCSSFRGEKQFQLVIHDVLKHNGEDVSEQPFSQRWQHIESLGLDDEVTWPHGSPTHLVILKAAHVSLTQLDLVLSESSVSIPHCGLIFVCQSKEFPNTRWTFPDSITAVFVADEVEYLQTAGKNKTVRAYLSCRDETNGIVHFEDEFMDFHENGDLHDVTEGSLVECMLRRSVDGTSHWWDLLRVLDEESGKPSYCREVEELVHSPLLGIEELRWLANITNYLCVRCHLVNDLGKHCAQLKGYVCRDCWEATGHGDCVSCGQRYTSGAPDTFSERFYCDQCWALFLTTRSFPTGAPPPPPDAKFTKQVSTRVISLLIDRVASKGPTSDILELCCGGSVVRKWLMSSAMRYVGIDRAPNVVEETNAVINTNGQLTNSSGVSQATRCDVVCGDVFDPQVWSVRLVQLHPTQFHVITLFSGLQQCFSSEQQVRESLFRISNALVPNGLFLTAATSAAALFRKGRTYENSVFRSSWEDDASPWMGSTYCFQWGDNDPSSKNVVPLDVLIAIAHEFNLCLLREVSFTFGELLQEDDRWTRGLSQDEKEYLGMRMIFVFRKSFQKLKVEPAS